MYFLVDLQELFQINKRRVTSPYDRSTRILVYKPSRSFQCIPGIRKPHARECNRLRSWRTVSQRTIWCRKGDSNPHGSPPTTPLERAY